MLFEIFGFFLFLYAVYKIALSPYRYWEKKGYPYVEGSFPFGSKPRYFFAKEYQGYGILALYNKLEPHPFGGVYVYNKPRLLLRDPNVIKHIMVKDSVHFRSRFGKQYSKKDPLSQHLFNLEEDLWKNVRVKLTPTFTSGKLKLMYCLFETCAERMTKMLEEKCNESGEVDIKEVYSCFTTDIIASCAFGLETDSINNPDNEFREAGKLIFKPDMRFIRKFRTMLFFIFPFLRTFYNGKFLNDKANDFIMNLVKDTVEYRKNNNVQRPDFLNLLIEMNEKHLSTTVDNQAKEESSNLEMDLGMMAAQCFVFYAAGFETSSSVQSYALYELALNQNYQDKLRAEVDQVVAKHGGKVTYQAFQEMTYLEQVIFETMRKYPTIPVLTRRCTKHYKSDEIGLEVEKDMSIIIPVYALHHDPKYFPDPKKFDPERFSEENKSAITPYTYLPFGEGPRICIGMRFGILQTKLGLVTLLSKFRVKPAADTRIPLKFVPSFLVTTADCPIKLLLEKRTSPTIL